MNPSSSSSSSGSKGSRKSSKKGIIGLRWLSKRSEDKSNDEVTELSNQLASTSTGNAQQGAPFLSGGSVNWANPEWTIPSSNSDTQGLVKEWPCMVKASLRILSRSPIPNLATLNKILELWVDRYDGSHAHRPYYTLVYILLGAKLTQKQSTSSNSEYTSKFQGVIRLGHKSTINPPPADKFRLVMNEGEGDYYYMICFECEIISSRRKGSLYSDLFKLNGYHYSFLDAMDLLNLEVILDKTGIISPS